MSLEDSRVSGGAPVGRGVYLILLLQVQAVCFELWENTYNNISQKTCPRRGRRVLISCLCNLQNRGLGACCGMRQQQPNPSCL